MEGYVTVEFCPPAVPMQVGTEVPRPDLGNKHGLADGWIGKEGSEKWAHNQVRGKWLQCTD